MEQTATAFVAGSCGAGVGSFRANSVNNKTQSSLSRIITRSIDETTDVHSMLGNTAAARAASNAAKTVTFGQSLADSSLEAASKSLNIVLDDKLEDQ